MLSRTKRLATVAAAALALSSGLPATAARATAGPCTAATRSTGSEVAIVLEGHYSYANPKGGDVTLTCHIVQNGVKVVSVTDPVWGPVAALASDHRLGTDPFYVCYTLFIREAGPEGFPTGHYHHTSC